MNLRRERWQRLDFILMPFLVWLDDGLGEIFLRKWSCAICQPSGRRPIGWQNRLRQTDFLLTCRGAYLDLSAI
jgi:hypothetical protein